MKMKKRNIWKAGIGVLLSGIMAFSLAGSSDSSSASSADDSDKIVIGGTFTLSGASAHAGESTLEGAQLAVKYINENGGVNGKQVELVYYDDEFDESKIPTLYERLINEDKVDLLTSPYTSPFLAAAPIAAKCSVSQLTVILQMNSMEN